MFCSMLTKSCLKRVDAFQIRGLRKILGRKHTYWDREATNKNILKEAIEEAFRKGAEANMQKKTDTKKSGLLTKLTS